MHQENRHSGGISIECLADFIACFSVTIYTCSDKGVNFATQLQQGLLQVCDTSSPSPLGSQRSW